jgi:hypothetical protein
MPIKLNGWLREGEVVQSMSESLLVVGAEEDRAFVNYIYVT